MRHGGTNIARAAKTRNVTLFQFTGYSVTGPARPPSPPPPDQPPALHWATLQTLRYSMSVHGVTILPSFSYS